MSHYWATFTRRGSSCFRLDTRIYLVPCDAPKESDIALGCIVGKNPGSATGKRRSRYLQPIYLSGDKFLPTVLSIVRQSYALANVALPTAAYVRVLNLFYLCDRDLGSAKKALRACPRQIYCPYEKAAYPWQWVAWGGADTVLDPLKARFAVAGSATSFYYDGREKLVAKGIPDNTSLAKHTQGMPQRAVVEYLAMFLSAS